MVTTIDTCKECGGKELSWSTHNHVDCEVPQGRLRSNEVKCLFVLGCDECSETLQIVSADEIADFLNGVDDSDT